jgi:hypothetical protein
MALVVALAVMNGGCLLIPQLKDRIVELAVTGSTTVEFHASGLIPSFDEAKPFFDLRDSVDLAGILDDAGINVADVKNISLSGVAYRVSVKDPEPSREIVNGTVKITRFGGSEQPLVTAFNAAAGAVTPFTTATLDPAGVTELNNLLDEWLAELKGGAPANTRFSYHVSGDSSPPEVNTDFYWQVKITISITGTVKVSVPT